MNKIKVLSAEQAIKIAAGEVIERPANIIKEILENSIDAGATKITLFIEQAGKRFIKIIDNGSGMTPDDAKLSVQPHATSKISFVEELESILTFGFRGEALASINAMSNVTITTKTESVDTGTKISWNFGKLQEESLCAHPTGTTIEITNLFDNFPARQKFLKKDETEWRAIVTLFQAFCLDYTNIHFQLYADNKLQFNCPAVKNIADRVAQLFDTSFFTKMLPIIDLKNNLCSVTGIISTSHYYRYDRNQIFIFVNQRWVKNIDLTKAIMRGYAGILPTQKYPAAIIFITTDTTQVDINIHPKKEEVKFLHPKKIESVITSSINATLSQAVSSQLQSKATQPSTIHYEPTYITKQPDFFISNNKQPLSFIDDQKPLIMPKSFVINSFEPVSKQPIPEIIKKDNEQQIKIELDEQSEFIILGQYKCTYIIGEKQDTLIFIDQHAAHERILYEQFTKNFENVATVQLMFPEFIKLQAQDIITIAPYLNLLEQHGIAAEIFSDTQILIQSTPVHIKNQSIQEIIQQFVGWIISLQETDAVSISKILHEKIHTKMACAAAIKAGDILNNEQMHQLVNDLMKIEHRFSCPHGRPTFWTLPIDYLEKQFKRDYGKKAEQLYDFL